ncbi:conserved exported hypothetical protein [Vibrio nigripulchritudo SO65]|uniref:hypothetical protein n=1 Tax=Vibrio nigripulchritudo TaxID=28173 RepID=UPI0003B1A639|nr:hypothetical protein [Vibrio nigripulchritudo]CCN38552.1 conserved exported hypothetical protein [Vibrio nigripulchritudo AM115]CCN42033.1 conserved exported hypothetical protein [Vibrio nigripulchritudo FTn2]CCN67267.1 conserved exported hypothetical protein [Vibrio nigripulchritudo POn4]CCN76332.1 conserved exported hypothetical protein [Vibrio nigripulchritudo SO65]
MYTRLNFTLLFTLVAVIGCDSSTKAANQNNSTKPVIETINKTPELAAELKAQPTLNDQMMVLYEKFEPILDRTESLTGTDINQNGIRDDLDQFINALEVSEPIRKLIRQDARFHQENLNYDFSEPTEKNIAKAWKIADEQLKVLACYEYQNINVDEMIDVSRTITAFTYNTKARTIAYLQYNHLQDGSVSTLLDPKEEYCE